MLNIDKSLKYLNLENVDKNLNTLDNSQTPDKRDHVKECMAEWGQFSKQGYSSTLKIKQSPPKGLGLFADKNYSKDSYLEYCHCIMSAWKGKYIQEPSYRQYAYWDGCNCKDCQMHGTRGMILLGGGSIVNSCEHQHEANVSILLIPRMSLAVILAIKDIREGEELVTWHGKDYYNSWCLPRHKNQNPTENQNPVENQKPTSRLISIDN